MKIAAKTDKVYKSWMLKQKWTDFSWHTSYRMWIQSTAILVCSWDTNMQEKCSTHWIKNVNLGWYKDVTCHGKKLFKSKALELYARAKMEARLLDTCLLWRLVLIVNFNTQLDITDATYRSTSMLWGLKQFKELVSR